MQVNITAHAGAQVNAGDTQYIQGPISVVVHQFPVEALQVLIDAIKATHQHQETSDALALLEQAKTELASPPKTIEQAKSQLDWFGHLKEKLEAADLLLGLPEKASKAWETISSNANELAVVLQNLPNPLK